MSNYKTFISLASEKLVEAGNGVHSINADRRILLSALHNTGMSLLYSMQALLWFDKNYSIWNRMEGATGNFEGFENVSFSQYENFLQVFSRVAGKYGIGLSELGAFQEIFRLGELHETGVAFGKGKLRDEQLALALLDYERFISLFEKAAQLHDRVARLNFG